MQAHVDVQERAMRVLQGRSHLHVMSMSREVCQQLTPDPMVQDAEHGGNNGDGETQVPAGESKEGKADATDAAEATGERGEGERQ